MRRKQKPVKRSDQPRPRTAGRPLARTKRQPVAWTPTRETASELASAVADRPTAAAVVRRPSCLFVDGNVRSGQTIEHLGGDVTVLGSVGSGAEIVAGGSVHIYGVLRGRALAGVGGDRSARVLCQRFEAELVAIDGNYRLSENLDPALRGHAIQARLDGAGMALTPID